MTPEEERLLKYAIRFGSDGNWMPNQEDVIPALDRLQERGFIERSECGWKWRLL